MGQDFIGLYLILFFVYIVLPVCCVIFGIMWYIRRQAAEDKTDTPRKTSDEVKR